MAALPWTPVSLPAGTDLPVRLISPVSSRSDPGTTVDALLTAPVLAAEREVLPAGLLVRGTIYEARASTPPEGRALVRVDFSEILSHAGEALPIKAKVVAVDNARETVRDDGAILGMAPIRQRPGKVEDVLLLAAHAHPAILAGVLIAKEAIAHIDRPHVAYAPGVDITLTLVEGLQLTSPIAAPPGRRRPTALQQTPTIRSFIDSLPIRTTAAKPPLPSDLTNFVFLTEERSLRAAFEDAGWATAEALSLRTEVETFFAVADHHSFRRAPVSLLELDGRAPDIVFQKQTNTFSKRHHVRIWRRSGGLPGSPVWMAAATHDVGIDFSREARTFTHRVEPNVDLERAKIVNDLCFTGLVSRLALVPRPSAPKQFRNATGDDLQTDGAIAVVEIGGETALFPGRFPE